MRKPPLPSRSLDRSRSLRKEMTDAERKLWNCLRAGQMDGLKFRRQHSIPPYIADFYCDAAKPVIELDGSQHNESVDRARTEYLQGQGFEVMRFWDNDVLLNIESVVDAIWNTVAHRTLTPTPLPVGEGL
ncbi:endonuclease domain-containing protein [Lysobacter tyrosinilyticus]